MALKLLRKPRDFVASSHTESEGAVKVTVAADGTRLEVGSPLSKVLDADGYATGAYVPYVAPDATHAFAGLLTTAVEVGSTNALRNTIRCNACVIDALVVFPSDAAVKKALVKEMEEKNIYLVEQIG